MKILIAAASPWSGLADTAMLLAQAGLKPVQPAPLGNGLFQSAADWHTQLLETLDLHPEGLNATGPLPVGKLWEDMAVGLLRANLGPADWFMADTRATWALDFWASTDPQARFLLLYLPAEAALYTARQQALADNVNAAETWDPTPSAQAWLRHNRQLLRLAQAQPARTLLVNSQQAVLHPQRLVNTLANALGVQTATPGDLTPWDAPIYLSASMEALVAPALAAELRALNRQLREAQTPLLSGGTQLVLAPNAQTSAPKAPGLLGWLGKNKQAEQALASAHAELAHTQADLGHAQDLITALSAKKERLHRTLAQAEQAHTHTLAVLQQAQEQAQENAEQQTAALAQAQGELTLVNAQLHLLRTELDTQKTERQTQTGVLTQQISTLKAQLETAAQQATSVQQAKASEVAEITQESELLLQQLHQVQEELEKIYHEREALKPQLAAAEQAKAQAEKAQAVVEKKAADLAKQAQEAKAAKEQADKAKTAAEQAKAQAESAKAEAEKKSSDLAKQAQEAKTAKEQADKAKTAAEQGKAQAESAKAEAERKSADLAKQAHEAKASKEQADKAQTAAELKSAELTQQMAAESVGLSDQTRTLQEAQQESAQLLRQLHSVQEELESYFFKHKEAQQLHAQMGERLDRLLQRLPAWADAAQLRADKVTQEPEHQCLLIRAHKVWVGLEDPISHLQFMFGVRDGAPYLEFRPGAQGGVPVDLMPWPAHHADEIGPRLLLSPEALGALRDTQESLVAQLTSVQWRLVRGLLVLIGSQSARLGHFAVAERRMWANAAQQLLQQLEALSPGVHFKKAEVMSISHPLPGLEVVRLAIRDLTTTKTRLPLIVFDVGLHFKNVRGKTLLQTLHIDFRPWNGGVAPLNGYAANEQDEQGEFMRLSFKLKGGSSLSPLRDLPSDDVFLVTKLLDLLPTLISSKALERHDPRVARETWSLALASCSKALA